MNPPVAQPFYNPTEHRLINAEQNISDLQVELGRHDLQIADLTQSVDERIMPALEALSKAMNDSTQSIKDHVKGVGDRVVAVEKVLEQRKALKDRLKSVALAGVGVGLGAIISKFGEQIAQFLLKFF